ncbi:MAG: AI-2E family transporter, partial [Chloroflexi bacterium]|nr:AI-2E family transporter [Chloroflexota bacterium]
AIMYFIFRQAEDYFVIPNVLGRAVRLHPLVVLFSVACGGVIGGILGLVIAVPIAASVKEIALYLYAKLLDRPVEFQPIRTLGGGIIEIPVHGRLSHTSDGSASEGTAPQ